MNQSCRVCSSNDFIDLVNLGNLPIAHRLVLSPNESEFVHPLKLRYCQNCGLIEIENPIEPSTLYLDYNYCFSSWKPQPHIEDEIATILTHTQGQSVFEIGCNDGSFLESLKNHGISTVAGLEPNPFASKLSQDKGFPVYSDWLQDTICQEAIKKFGKFETVVARQVFEHVEDIKHFFKCLNILLREDGFVFIDIPDFEMALTMGDCSVIWEEHVNYFTEGVLKEILQRFGYRSISVKRYNFSGGTIAILAQRQPNITHNGGTNPFGEKVRDFSQKVNDYGALLKKTLTHYRESGFKIALYGVGCRACTLVNGLSLGAYIDFAVDDQVERQNKYMPGSKLPIFPSQKLNDASAPVLCLLAVNQENEEKVKSKIQTLSNLDIEFVSLFSPNDIWSEIKQLKQFSLISQEKNFIQVEVNS